MSVFARMSQPDRDYTVPITILVSVLASITYAGIVMSAIQRPGGLCDTQHRGLVMCFACGFPMLAIINSGYDHWWYLLCIQLLLVPAGIVARLVHVYKLGV